jgi:hypothetical protein
VRLLTGTGHEIIVPPPYVPLLDPEVVVRRPNTVVHLPSERRLSKTIGGLEPLTLPAEVTDALDAYQASAGETFEPSKQLAALGVSRLVREAAAEWRSEHARRRLKLYTSFRLALHAAAPDLYRQCGDKLDTAVDDGDNAAFTAHLAAAAHLRQWLPGVQGRRGGRRVSLDPWTVEWHLAAPHLHAEDGRPALTTTTVAEHRDRWGWGTFTAPEVVANLGGPPRAA